MHRDNPATQELWVVSKVGGIPLLAVERIEKNTMLLQQYFRIAVGHDPDPSLKPPLLAASSAPSL